MRCARGTDAGSSFAWASVAGRGSAVSVACRAAAGAALLFFWLTSTARAQETPYLHVEPNPAPAGTPLTVRLGPVDFCNRILATEVTRQGSAVTLMVTYEPGLICGPRPPPGPLSLPLGHFEPGRYTLAYISVGLFGPQPQLTTSFEVSPVSIPAIAPTQIAVLIGALAAFGLLALGRRRSPRAGRR